VNFLCGYDASVRPMGQRSHFWGYSYEPCLLIFVVIISRKVGKLYFADQTRSLRSTSGTARGSTIRDIDSSRGCKPISK
jgi:hypothetical protein